MTTTLQGNIPRISLDNQSEMSYNSEWQGCYGEAWGDLLTPESMSHPAKFSLSLIRRILEHMLERGYIQPGQTIIDPFGGVGNGAIATWYGLNWIGIELERKFHDMGHGCQCTGLSTADYRRFFSRFRPDSLHKINYKDGRHLCPACLASLGKVEEGPALPLSYQSKKRRARIAELQKSLGKRLGRAVVLVDPLPFPEKYKPAPVARSLFDEPVESGPVYKRNSGKIPVIEPHTYEGNLTRFRKYAQSGTYARLIQGDSRRLRQRLAETYGGLVSSPPYANGCAHTGGTDPNPQHIQGGKRGAYGVEAGYGATEGQLGGMTEGDLDGVISSPPYEGIRMDGGGDFAKNGKGGMRPYTGESVDAWCTTRDQTNLGNLPPGGFDAAITSPPFAGNTGGRGEASRQGIDAPLFDRHSGGMKRGTGENPDNLDHLPLKGFTDALVSSPPFSPDQPCASQTRAKKDYHAFTRGDGTKRDHAMGSEGNLDSLPMVEFNAAISSPPFADSVGSDSPEKRGGLLKSDPRRAGDRNLTGSYGVSEGQLGAMKAEGLVSSPPFADSTAGSGSDSLTLSKGLGGDYDKSLAYEKRGFLMGPEEYKQWAESCNLGSFRQPTETFWAAAKMIVSECFEALKPGAYSAWVLKAFIRDGQRVDFPGQWQQLCEVCGFEFVEEIRAMLVTDNGTQAGLEGEDKRLRKERKSFFRRLHESRLTKDQAHLRIDWETVLIMRKPLH